MDFKFEQKSLRVYPLPYVEFRVGPQHIFHVQNEMSKLQAAHLDFPEAKVRSAFERMLVSMVFADVYDKEDQFLKLDAEAFTYQKDFDFTHGKSRISLSTGRVNEKMEETGTKVRFRVSTRVVNASKAEWFVLAAIHMPHIQFIGWTNQADLKPFVKGYSANIYAGCDRIKPMFEIPIENKRRKGIFV